MPGSAPGDVAAGAAAARRDSGAQRPAQRLGPGRTARRRRGSTARRPPPGTANTSVGVARNASATSSRRAWQPGAQRVDGHRDPRRWWRRRRTRSCRAPACPSQPGEPVARPPARRRAGRRRRSSGSAVPSGGTGAAACPRPRWASRRGPAPRSPGAARSTAATRAPQRSSDGSGPISAPAPSTATVCPSSRSQSGLSQHQLDRLGQPTARRLRRATQASSRRRRASPRSRSPR